MSGFSRFSYNLVDIGFPTNEQHLDYSEFDVFETAVQWMLYDWDTRKVHTNEVMNTVRLGLLTPLQLTQISHSPELTKGASYPREYTELLAYGSVKSMIDDGLA